MKKEFFKPGDLYFICENCGEMCSARGPKLCDNCGEQYTGHEILTYNEAIDKKRENLSKFQSHMIQPIPVQPKMQHGEAVLNSIDELPLPRQARLEQPVFSYSIRIYEEGQWVNVMKDSEPIAFYDKVMRMGRESFLSTSRIFNDGLSMDSRFIKISRRNVVFIQEEENLFVQYCREDGRKKSSIRINGEKLEQGKCRQVGEGDEILFGSVKYPEQCIAMYIHKWLRQPQENEDFHEKIYQEINRLTEGVTHMEKGFINLQTQMAEMDEKINSFTANIDPETLKWKEGDSQESYENRLDSILPKGGAEETMSLIKQFFLWDTSQGQKDCSPNYSFMWSDKELAHYLYSAAFYEKVCSSHFDGTEHEDYYPACGSLGKAVEEFVRKEVAALITRYLQPQFKAYLEGRNYGNGKFVPQKQYLLFLKGKENGETEIRRLFTSLGISKGEEQNRRLKEWRKAIQDILDIADVRNKNAHPGSISKDEYMKLKKLVLHSNAAWTIHQYYILMVEKNG